MPYEFELIETTEPEDFKARLTAASTDGWELVDHDVAPSGFTAKTQYTALLRRSTTPAPMCGGNGIEVGSDATEAPAGLSTGDNPTDGQAAEAEVTPDVTPDVDATAVDDATSAPEVDETATAGAPSTNTTA